MLYGHTKNIQRKNIEGFYKKNIFKIAEPVSD
jgi:hypothetical protein